MSRLLREMNGEVREVNVVDGRVCHSDGTPLTAKEINLSEFFRDSPPLGRRTVIIGENGVITGEQG